MKLLKFEYTPLNVVCDTDVLKLLPAKVIKTFKKRHGIIMFFLTGEYVSMFRV